MANQEHLDILNQGVEIWNQWRERHSEVQPDLSETDLTGTELNGTDLSSANLCGAHLSKAHLRAANLSRAHLSDAYLIESYLDEANLCKSYLSFANLSGAHLNEAHLNESNLGGANLSRTDLTSADLSNAKLEWTNFDEAKLSGAHFNNTSLSHANFSRAYLDGADFSGAKMSLNVFGDVDLSMVKGLDTVYHWGPSTIGINTIYHSQGNIPEVFLRGAGVDDTFITYIRSLVGKPIEYYSCFISYSSRDEPFAKRLYADLQSNNVRCWYAPEDLKIGDKFRQRIDESIHLYDKLLLVLSESSLASTWVAYEVEKALNKEPEGVPNVLFPIRLDTTILTSETDWAKEIRRSRHIGDFEHWKNHDSYQRAFQRLLRDLKAQS